MMISLTWDSDPDPDSYSDSNSDSNSDSDASASGHGFMYVHCICTVLNIVLFCTFSTKKAICSTLLGLAASLQYGLAASTCTCKTTVTEQNILTYILADNTMHN